MSFLDTQVEFDDQVKRATDRSMLSWAKLNAMLALAQGLMAIALAIREVAGAINAKQFYKSL